MNFTKDLKTSNSWYLRSKRALHVYLVQSSVMNKKCFVPSKPSMGYGSHTSTCAKTSASSRRGRLKFLVTSRPYDDIQEEFQRTLHDLPTIRLRGEEENDQIHREIDLVIRKQVGNLAKDLKLDHRIMCHLESKLLEMEHRKYLWLYLAIESIYETFRDSMRPEEALIESLPSTNKVRLAKPSKTAQWRC